MGRRTHVMLSDQQYAFLVGESARTGLSRGELIRRAVDAVYRPGAVPKLNGVEISVGVWRRPDAALAGRRPPRL